MTEAELQALIELHGGEVGGPGAGRYKDPRTAKIKRTRETEVGPIELPGEMDNPNPTWLIETNSGRTIKVQPQPDGTYLPIDVPARPTGAATHPPLVDLAGGGKGVWDPATNKITPLPETIPTPETKVPTIQQSGGTFWRYDPVSGQMVMAGYNPIELQQQQEARDRQLEQDRATLDYRNAQTALERARTLNQIDEAEYKQRKDEWDQWYKVNVEFPVAQRKEEDVLRGNALEYGRQAGAAAVSDITAGLPYRYSPGFTERRAGALQAAAGGDYRAALRTPIAQGYRAPDLAGARAQAERGSAGGYLGAFGFDAPAIASAIPYRGTPPATGAAPAVMDDDEIIRNLARQFA